MGRSTRRHRRRPGRTPRRRPPRPTRVRSRPIRTRCRSDALKPVDQTPTEAADYAAISALYGSLLAALAYSARAREPIGRAELLPLSAATFALSKLVVHEKVDTWLRRPFVEEDGAGKKPRGRRLRYAVGELLDCTRCMGAWSALGLVALRLHSPAAGRTVTTVLATSAANDFMQTTFSLLCARSNATQTEASRLDEERQQRVTPARRAA